MQYRILEERDIPQIKKIIEEGSPYLGLNGYYVYWLTANLYRGYSFVAEDDDSVCGFVTVLPHPDERAVFVWQLGVAKDMRRKQIACHLLREVWKYAVSKELPGMITSINKENPASLNSFRKIAEENGLQMKKIGRFEADGFSEDVYKFS